MDIIGSFPTIAACVLFRIGVFGIWEAAAIVSIGLILTGVFLKLQDGVKSSLRTFPQMVASAVLVYLGAATFFAFAPHFNIIWYAASLFLLTYSIIFATAFLLEKQQRIYR